MNRDNDIRRAFRAKLSDYPSPLPAEGWERVEQSMSRIAATRRVLRRRWYAGTAAALLLLLVGSLLFLQMPLLQEIPMLTEQEKHPAGGQLPSAVPAVPDHADLLSLPHQEPARPATAGLASVRRKGGEKNLLLANNPAGMMERWIRQNGVAPDRSLDDLLPVFQSLIRKGDLSRYAIPAGHIEEVISVSSDDDQLFAENVAVGAGDERLTIGLGGRGGLSTFRQTVNSPMTLRSASLATEAQYSSEGVKNMLTTTRTADNLSEMEHDQPVSFGITLSKSIFDNLFIESGLTYTYLSSRLRNANANFRIEETQKIHYLGIPVNLNYTLFSVKRFNLYASVGGMLEKDLYGEYRKLGTGETLDFNSTAEEEEVKKISQRNPQLSVNAGVGLSYPLMQHLRIYGKVGGAYYFDAGNEYKTIYSDRKIVMDLNIGLRVEF